jgi:cellulose synthase/poly-beta-1,6-N-acetylglucosamine synthase-like glycosyltransferase
MTVVVDVLRSIDVAFLAYAAVLNAVYLVLITIASFDAVRQRRSLTYAGDVDVFGDEAAPGVSIVVPAWNEEAVIVDSVRSLLALRYPKFEVIVVDDGSTDGTYERLREAFGLVDAPIVVPGNVPVIGQVHSIHVAADGAPLRVVRKENARRRADATNVGLDIARHPLVLFVDADAMLEPDALLRVARPFVDDPERVVGVGGSVRPVNGSRVERGHVDQPRAPKRWIERIQVIEYLRAFLLGRVGWSRLGGLVVISGAFGMFRRDVLVEIGGFDSECIGEDAELVVRLHRHLRERGADYRFVFVAEPVCWTEVPPARRVLAHQRRRWSLGLVEVLWKHRAMLGNPRYGRIGLLVLPYFLVFELLGAVVELLGAIAIVAGFVLGVAQVKYVALLALVMLAYGALLSIASVTIEELSYRRYTRWRDIGIGLVASLVENVGYRQAHAWWRLRGLVDAARRRSTWVKVPRTGFTAGR